MQPIIQHLFRCPAWKTSPGSAWNLSYRSILLLVSALLLSRKAAGGRAESMGWRSKGQSVFHKSFLVAVAAGEFGRAAGREGADRETPVAVREAPAAESGVAVEAAEAGVPAAEAKVSVPVGDAGQTEAMGRWRKSRGRRRGPWWRKGLWRRSRQWNG